MLWMRVLQIMYPDSVFEKAAGMRDRCVSAAYFAKVTEEKDGSKYKFGRL